MIGMPIAKKESGKEEQSTRRRRGTTWVCLLYSVNPRPVLHQAVPNAFYYNLTMLWL